MSLEQKIRSWEDELPGIFEHLKSKLGQESITINRRHGQRCYHSSEYDFKYQKCSLCNYIYNNLSFKEKGGIIPIPTGKKKGINMIIMTNDRKGEYHLSPSLKKANNEIGQKIHQFYKDELFCISNIDWYTTNNPLLNISLMMMIIKLYSSRKNFPLYLDFNYTYECSGTNYLIYIEKEYESIDGFHKNPTYNISFSPLAQKKVTPNFTKEAIRDMLFQSCLSLKFYGNLFFTHNSLDYTYLRFENKAYHIQLDREYIFSFKCTIFPSVHSSICIYDSKRDWWGRFTYASSTEEYINPRESIPYNGMIIDMNGTENHYLTNPPPFLPKKEGEYYMKYRIYFYRIKEMSHYYLKMRREKGSVWGINSFDVVCLFCSLMSISYFRNTVCDDSDLKRIWLGLWRRGEASEITEILSEQKKPLLFNDVYRVIKKFYIRFDAVNYLYEELRKII